MDKKVVFSHYAAVLNELMNSDSWFKLYLQRPWVLENDLELENVDFCFGATRACMIGKDYPYVVKFDTEVDGLGDSCCAREVEVYKTAKEAHCERYLAEAEYIGTYCKSIEYYNIEDFDGIDMLDIMEEEDIEDFAYRNDLEKQYIQIAIPLYAYPRAEGYDCGDYDEKLATTAKKVVSPLCDRNVMVAVAFINEYGVDEYYNFSDFCLEMNINDLHMGNIGSVDGHLVIIDYGSYHDGCTGSW